jgi:hypothetical protein
VYAAVGEELADEEVELEVTIEWVLYDVIIELEESCGWTWRGCSNSTHREHVEEPVTAAVLCLVCWTGPIAIADVYRRITCARIDTAVADTHVLDTEVGVLVSAEIGTEL